MCAGGHETAVAHFDSAKLILRVHAAIGSAEGHLGVPIGGLRGLKAVKGLHGLVRQPLKNK